MPAFNKLNPEDIDEKIRLNHKDGTDIYRLLESLKEELKDCKWVELRARIQCQLLSDEIMGIEENPLQTSAMFGLIKQKRKEISLFRGQEIASAVQCQFYVEQIEHIEKRIREINLRPNKDNPFAEDTYAEKLIPAPLLR
jgi:hypothetical protein